MRDRLLDQLLTPDLGYADADTGYDNALSARRRREGDGGAGALRRFLLRGQGVIAKFVNW